MKTDLELVAKDPLLLEGLLVFKGTRVSVETLFDHLDKGHSLQEFLLDFPSVNADQAQEVLKIGKRILDSKSIL